MDVLWLRAGRRPNETENLFARVEPGKMMVMFDRGDYWQCAYVIAKRAIRRGEGEGIAGAAGRRRADGADPDDRALPT